MTWPESSVPRGSPRGRTLVTNTATTSRGTRVHLGRFGGDLQHAVLGIVKRARRQHHLLELHSLGIRFVAETDRRIAAAPVDSPLAGTARLVRSRHLFILAAPTGTATATVRSCASGVRLAPTILSGATGIALSLLAELLQLLRLLLEKLLEVLQGLLPLSRVTW